AIGAVVGYVVVVPLMLLAQIPIESVQDFVLKLLKPLLTAGAGEFRTYLDDELQAANVRRRVADAARALLRRAGCDELIIVAHSHPGGEGLDEVGGVDQPIEEQVTNAMNILTDHGGYFANDEQVLIRLAAEISATHHADSAFWPAPSVLFDAIRKRRERVSAL